MLLRPVLMPILRNPLQGIADGIRNMLAELLGSSQFFAPLTHSLVLSRGAGSPTFTRADATNCATFRDWEGVLRTVPSGCARFEGARMVRNLLTFTEDFSDAAWVKYRAPVMTYSQPAPDGTNTATKVAPTLVGGTNAGVYASAVTGTGRTLITSFYVKPSNWTWIQINKQDGNNGVWFNLVAGTVGTQSAGTTGAIEALDDGWFRCSIVSASAATSYSEIAIVDGDNTTATTGNSVDGIFIWHPQLEDVTGQADQTASEYVSVGVESAPAYHGSMVDGVEFFNTDRDGAVIPAATNTGYLAEGARTNLCLQSNSFNTTWFDISGVAAVTQNATGPDGATSAWTFTDNNSGFKGRGQIIALTSGSPYTFSIFVGKTVGALTNYPVLLFSGTGYQTGIVINTTAGTTVDTIGSPYIANTTVVEDFNSDFWRVASTFTPTSTSNCEIYVVPAGSSDGSTINVSATGSAVFADAMLELGSFASTYIPTTTAAVTRAADVLTYPSAGNIDGTGGWCYAEIVTNSQANHAFVGFDTSNQLMSQSNQRVSMYDGANQAVSTSTITFGAQFNGAVTWGSDGVRATINGEAPGSNASFDGNAVDGKANIYIGEWSDGSSSNFGTIRNLRIGQRQLSASEMQAITA